MEIDYKNHYEELFNSLPDGAFVTDAQGLIRMMNQSGARILGYDSPEELIGHSILSCYVNSSDHDAMLSVLGHRGKIDKNIFDWKKKNGGALLVEVTIQPLRSGQGRIHGIQGVFRDISKRLESQIAQQETLAQTAARSIDEEKFLHAIHFYQTRPLSLFLQGIAHNLNTPLGSIRGRAELLEHHLKKFKEKAGAGTREELEALMEKISKGAAEIVGQVDRASQLIRGFANKISIEMYDSESDVDLNAIVRNEAAFMHSSLFFKHKIQVNLQLAEELPIFPASAALISQALHYLVLNSMMAVASQDDRAVTIRTFAEPSRVMLHMQDTRPASYSQDPHAERSSEEIPSEAYFGLFHVEMALASFLIEQAGGTLTTLEDGIQIAVPIRPTA